MCQILFKPKGCKLPSHSLLEGMARQHSDGCGYMVAWNGSVFGRKGLGVEELKKEIEAHEDKALVIHFRLRTSGRSGPTATHPFPFPVVGIRELKELTWQAPLGVAHNGMLVNYGRKKLSDTQEYILSICSFPDLANSVVRFDKRALGIFEAEQKWALMNGMGEVRLLGKWDKTDGLWHSATLTSGDYTEAWMYEQMGIAFEKREEEDQVEGVENCRFCRHFSYTPSKIRETCMICTKENKFEAKELLTSYGNHEYQRQLGNYHFVE